VERVTMCCVFHCHLCFDSDVWKKLVLQWFTTVSMRGPPKCCLGGFFGCKLIITFIKIEVIFMDYVICNVIYIYIYN